jgi:hypothetical protein
MRFQLRFLARNPEIRLVDQVVEPNNWRQAAWRHGSGDTWQLVAPSRGTIHIVLSSLRVRLNLVRLQFFAPGTTKGLR